MSKKSAAFNWARNYDFTEEELHYSTILQLKILDAKCQMNDEDQEIFAQVYFGIANKSPSVFIQEIHTLISDAFDGVLRAKADFKEKIHMQRVLLEDAMHRPTMKAYKAMVRAALAAR